MQLRCVAVYLATAALICLALDFLLGATSGSGFGLILSDQLSLFFPRILLRTVSWALSIASLTLLLVVYAQGKQFTRFWLLIFLGVILVVGGSTLPELAYLHMPELNGIELADLKGLIIFLTLYYGPYLLLALTALAFGSSERWPHILSGNEADTQDTEFRIEPISPHE
jgi:hypothetical protein